MSDRRALVALLALALALRLLAVGERLSRGQVDGDELAFANLAHTLATVGRFAQTPSSPPEIIRGPAYVAWLAPFVRVAGDRLIVPLVAQALLGVLVVFICSRLLARLLACLQLPPARARAFWLGGTALLACSPFAIFYERILMSEGFATALLVIATVAFVRANDGGRWRATLGAGAAFGALALAKPAMLGLLVLLAIAALVVRWRGGGGHPRAVLLAVAIAFAAIVPWTVRNYELIHRPVPVGIGGGVYLYLGTLPTDRSGVPVIGDDDRRLLDRYLSAAPNDERIAIDDDMRARARTRITAAPLRYVGLCVQRDLRLWVSSHADIMRGRLPGIVRLGIAALSLLLVLLAAVSLLVARGARVELLPFWLVPVYVTAAHTPILSGARYAVPAWPFVIVLATVALAALLARRQAATSAS